MPSVHSRRIASQTFLASLILSLALAGCAAPTPAAPNPTIPPAQPTQRPLQAIPAQATETPLPPEQPSASSPTADPGERVVYLAAVGDIMLSRDLGPPIEQGFLIYPFANFLDYLTAPDLTIGNFESGLGVTGAPADKDYAFQSPPGAAESLALAGFDLVTLANNHALDYGPEGLEETINLLNAQGIATVGAGPDEAAARAPVYMEVNGLRLAFLAYVDVGLEYGGFDAVEWSAGPEKPGVAWAIPENIRADTQTARQNADLVIVYLHGGLEFQAAPTQEQRDAAHAAIDGGAALVVGSHAHTLQGIEDYNGGLIVYGLGNFAFQQDDVLETTLINIWLTPDGVDHYELVPAILEGGRPRPANPIEADAIRARVEYLSNILNGTP